MLHQYWQNLYLAMLEQELEIICKAKNIKCPCVFKRFLDNGFVIVTGNKEQFIYGEISLITLEKTIKIDKRKFGISVDFMDLCMYQGREFYVSFFQKWSF